jgi:hypothetical protein
MDESDDFFDRAIKSYLLYRFLLAFFAFFISMVIGVGYVLYWLYCELSLEHSYHLKYGVTWQAEYEKYHGTLSHAHTQIIVSTGCMLALVAVLTWACRHMLHKHKHRRHDNAA